MAYGIWGKTIIRARVKCAPLRGVEVYVAAGLKACEL